MKNNFLNFLLFVFFRFDCGSGTGKVRSEETVILNQWNTVTIFRHRWDAWLILNQGNRVQGRSQVRTKNKKEKLIKFMQKREKKKFEINRKSISLYV